MKRGYQGRGCCNADKVWGISSNAPKLTEQDNDEEGSIFGLQGLPFGGVDNGPGEPKIHSGNSWSLSAAKVPTSYPYAGCDDRPPMSSADSATPEKEQWSVDIATLARIDALKHEGAGAGDINDWHFVWWTRAVCIDGVQRFVNYGINGWWVDEPNTETTSTYVPNLTAAYNPFPVGGTLNHDVVRVDIANLSKKTYSTAFLGHRSEELVHPYDPVANPDGYTNVANEMERQYLYMGYGEAGFPGPRPDIGPIGGIGNADDQNVYAAQTHYAGNKYYFRVTYSPDKCLVDGTGRWQAARIELKESPDRPVCYCSDGYIGQEQTGQYVIALPSVRAFLQSSVEHDEPRVCAIKVVPNSSPEEGDSRVNLTTELVTGVALNTNTRTTSHYLMDGEDHLVWDGTLQEGEKTNTIVPPVSGPYMGVEWNDIRVRCFNHVYGKDYALWTTTPFTSPDTTVIPDVADFDGGNLNHGIEDAGLAFVVQIGSTDEILVVNNSYYTDSGTWAITDPDEWAAEFDIGPGFNSQISLVLEDVEVVNDNSEISFDPRLDNRAYLEGSSTVRINLPADDGTPDHNHDTAEFWIDGVLRWSNYNIDGTTGEAFLNYYSQNNSGAFVVIDGITPGKHTFRWTLKRVTSINDLKFYLRRVQLPLIVKGDNISHLNWWLYDGERTRKAIYWKWPIRDDQLNKSLDERDSAVPDFIMPDKEGRILYGNQHYVTRVIVKDIDNEVHPNGVLDTTFFDNGFFRAGASPVIGASNKYFDGNCEWVDTVASPADTVSIGAWGRMQIQVTNSSIQLKGMNGCIQDATVDPLGIVRYAGRRIARGLITEGGIYTVVLDENASSVDGTYDGMFLFITDGDGKDQHTRIATSLGNKTLGLMPRLEKSCGVGSTWEIRTSLEEFGTFLNVGTNLGITRRVHGFTLKNNCVIPHLEIIYRPNMDRPAYPIKPPYTNPEGENGPWPVDGSMEADSSVLELITDNLINGGVSTRTLDPRQFPRKETGEPRTRKPVVSSLNKIVSRVYSDAFSRRPQYHWSLPHPFYYPDPTGGEPGPYPSVQWQLIWSHHCPTVGHVQEQRRMQHRVGIRCNNTNAVDAEEDDWHYTYDDSAFQDGYNDGGLLDFDAVDCNCKSCTRKDFTDKIRSLYNLDLAGEAKVRRVSTTTDPGSYAHGVGNNIQIVVKYSKSVKVVGNNPNSPVILLNNSGKAKYETMISDKELLFIYNGDEFDTAIPLLDYLDTSSLKFLDGEPGAIMDIAIQLPANYELPEPLSPNDELASGGIIIT